MKIILNLLIILLIVAAVAYGDSKVCNPKGSLAAQINWAGHEVCDE